MTESIELDENLMYKASLEKDVSFEGLFFMAVKTTGIFCRPSCTARKPKQENVEFFRHSKEAILKGYRPCKVCKPLQTLNETPETIKSILDELAEDPSHKFKDEDLLKRGIEPTWIRRWFLKNHGLTFQAFQRMYRINSAFNKLNEGESVTQAAFEAGYESLSGFGDSFKSIFGVSPKKGKNQRIINLKRLETPLGTMYACAVAEGICLLEFADRKMLETELKYLAKTLNATLIQAENPHFSLLEKELKDYFEGKCLEFTVPLFLAGSDFQQRVWQELRLIPFGKTRSYQEQAEALGKPTAVRAVANANGMNKISIMVPCHRVIGSDGELTGYGGGLWRKKYLLDLEKKALGI
jgi:AraC family transcriptional regulator, regulatory protein of adaptative response / methylated-DNA-[protein]-cysteine methyltransferase